MVKKFLIIDDDPIFRRVLSRSLIQKGFQVEVTEGALDLFSLQDFLPDFISLDLKLENESGISLIKELRDLYPNAKIVMLTGYGSIQTAVQAIKLGADNYVTKPIDTETLLAAFESTNLEHPPAKEDYKPLSPKRLEWEHIQKVLEEHDHNISATARALGMHRRTLQRKLQKKPVEA